MNGNDRKEVSDLRLWNDFIARPTLKLQRKKLIAAATKIFAMGSCFAMEIRRALARKNFDVYPHYTDVKFDPSSQIFDKMPEREDTPHYDTFVIRQEFETAFGLFDDRADGIWPVVDAPINQFLSHGEVFQGPYRKMVYGATRELTSDLTIETNRVVREGMEKGRCIRNYVGFNRSVAAQSNRPIYL